MLQKIDALATPSLGVPELLAATAPVGTSSPTGPGSDGGKAIGKASAPGQAGNQHGKSAGHQPETH